MLRKADGSEIARPTGEREIYLGPRDGFRPVPVFNRETLPAGFRAIGPMIIEERESTIVVGGEASVEIDEYGIVAIAM